LIKEKDRFVRLADTPNITEKKPDSAISQRTIEQIASDRSRVWQSSRAQDQQQASIPKPAKTHRPETLRPISLPSLKSVPTESFPGFINPQLARQTTSPPGGDGWIHELKLDGYRIQIQLRKKGKNADNGLNAILLTRKGLDWTSRMPEIAAAAERLPVDNAILDGETVVLNAKGGTNFADLQAAFQNGANAQLTYFAFDLLHLNGHNLRGLPLRERKKYLAQLVPGAGDDSMIRLSEHFETDGKEVFSKACALGAEGIVSKLASAAYRSDRGNAWLKSKCIQEQEFVIGGFTEPSNGNLGIGALLLGYYEDGNFLYAGRSGTGFSQQTQRTLRKQLGKLLQTKPAFTKLPKGISYKVHWVKPALVAQISFATWTRDNLLRQAAFKGLREDKPAREVVRETAIAPEKAQEEQPPPARLKPRLSSRRERGAVTTDLPITHPEKVLDEESGMTKQILATYYLAVAEQILPHIADRPLSVVRCPEGTGKPCFFQKHIGAGLPEGVDSIPVPNPKTGKKEDYLTLSTPEGLVGLSQMGVLEIHPWGSRNKSLEKPDRIVFDLDPDEAIDWKTLATTAKELRAALEKLGLESYLKTTGGKGLHVVVPIQPNHEWLVVKQFAHAVVLELEKKHPDLYLTKMTKALRKNHIYLDYLRNDRGATAVAPFSPRARSGVPVALPLEWRELNSKSRLELRVADFADWQNRLKKNPWTSMLSNKQRLSAQALRTAGS